MKKKNIVHEVKLKGDDVYITPVSKKSTETVIFLHGLGDSASKGFAHIFNEDIVSPFPSSTKVVLLQAPTAPVTVNKGYEMPSWYDIITFEPRPEEYEHSINFEGVQKSAERVRSVLQEEIRLLGGDSKRVAIGGLSQGCGLALHVGLECDMPLAGIIGWQGALFPMTMIHEANKKTPLLVYHGTKDHLMQIDLMDVLYKRVETEEYNVTRIKEEGLKHTLSDDMLKSTREFTEKLFEKREENVSKCQMF